MSSLEAPDDFQNISWPPTHTDPRATYYSTYSVLAPGRTLSHFFTQAGEHIEGALSAIPRGMCMQCRAPDLTRSSPRPAIFHQAPGAIYSEATQTELDSRCADYAPINTLEAIPEEDAFKSRGTSICSTATSVLFSFSENWISEILESDQDEPWYLPDAKTILNVTPPRRSARRNLEPRTPYDAQGVPIIMFSPASPCKKDFPRESWVDPPPYSLDAPSLSRNDTTLSSTHARRTKGIKRMMQSMDTLRSHACCV